MDPQPPGSRLDADYPESFTIGRLFRDRIVTPTQMAFIQIKDDPRRRVCDMAKNFPKRVPRNATLGSPLVGKATLE